ncbi:MAG: Purine nucleoside phosphoramidase [Chlamydiae bacterium]|nr:Purine nucleoside phosphoramidase [Chlamydiota bacterium]
MTIFEKIINKEIPADIVYEDDNVIAFRDIQPQAPIHILIVPKKPIATIQEVPAEDLWLIAEMVKAAQKIADKLQIDGYRLVINNGKIATQAVFHVHMHMLAGRQLSGTLG